MKFSSFTSAAAILLTISPSSAKSRRPNLRALTNGNGGNSRFGKTLIALKDAFPGVIITTDDLDQVNNILQQQTTDAMDAAATSTTDFDGNLMVDITEQDSYNQDWVAFDADELVAYAAISHELIPGQQDIRSVYYEYYASASTWTGYLLAESTALAAQVADQCDQACFNVVELQLINEFFAVANLNTWMTGYVDTQTSVSQHILNELDSAHAALSISATDGIASPKNTPWVGTMINILTLTQGLAPTLGWSKTMVNLITVTQKTAQFVYTQSQNGQSSTSQGSVTFQNDGLNLAYSNLVSSIQSTYDSLNEVGDNQAQAICGNYGKLLSFYDQVFPQSAPASSTEIASFVGNMDDTYTYQSYEWLFPSKYQMCSQVVDYYDSNTGCLGPKMNPHETYHLGTAKGNEQECHEGQCQSHGKTCQVNAYVWLCLKSSSSHLPPTSVTGTLDTNAYAKKEGLVVSNDFTATVLNACKSSFKGGTCNAAGMALNIAKQGDCVENWNDADGSGHCDTSPTKSYTS